MGKVKDGEVSDVRNEIQSFISNLGIDKLSSECHIIPDKELKKDDRAKNVMLRDKNVKKRQEIKTKKLEKKVPFANKYNKWACKEEPRLKKEGNKQRNYLLVKPGTWDPDEFPSDPKEFEPVSKQKEKELEELAKKIMEEEVAIYKSQMEKEKKSTYSWLKTVSSKGTSEDKTAAFVVFVQESPVHNIAYMDSLISRLHKEKRHYPKALDAVKELFLQDLLVKNRKLRSLDQHPLGRLEQLSSGNKDSKNKRLLIWYFESLLKKTYSDFIHTLEVFSKDTVEAVRKKALAVIWDLLCENPEQEKLLLSLLINKLGDPTPKIASHAVHLVHKLLLRHKRMNLVVTLETERVLCRTNISKRAQYYAICLLSGLKLQRGDDDLACRLLDVYFGFFKTYVGKGDIETKMLSAILTGVNKVYPYAKDNREKILEQTEALYKICHMAKFGTSVQALMLLHQVIDVSDKACDRFYMLLYKKLFDAELPVSNKLPLFLNLLCKSMKKDVVEKRVQAFMKRLLQVSQFMAPPLVCSALCLLSQVVRERPLMMKFENNPEEEEDSGDEEHFVDEVDDEHNTNEEDGDTDENKAQEQRNEQNKKAVRSSWVHRSHTSYHLKHYDMWHRNPLYCRAELDCVYELENFLNHSHPTVVIFAQNLLKGESIKYSGDPLIDFTLKRFLERFVTKNPKKALEEIEGIKGQSAKRKKSKNTGSDDESVDDDEDVNEAADVDKDVNFGCDFGNVFDDEGDHEDEELLRSDNEEEEFSSDVDELSEDEEKSDDGQNGFGAYSEKALKQKKWEEVREEGSDRKKRKRGRFNSKKGPKAKKQRK